MVERVRVGFGVGRVRDETVGVEAGFGEGGVEEGLVQGREEDVACRVQR